MGYLSVMKENGHIELGPYIPFKTNSQSEYTCLVYDGTMMKSKVSNQMASRKISSDDAIMHFQSGWSVKRIENERTRTC